MSNSLQPHELQQPRPPVLRYIPEFAQTHVHLISDAIQPSYPLLPPSPCAFNLSQHQGLFQWVSSLHQVAKVLELELQHQTFQWQVMVDFLYDWLVWYPCSPRDSQESSPAPQFESINSLAFSLLYSQTLTSVYMTTDKTIALTIQTFVGKMISLLFNTLFRFVIPFLPRSNCLLISWQQPPSALILEPKKRKSVTASTFSPSICHEGWDQMPWS